MNNEDFIYNINSNSKLKLAFEFVQNTNKNIYLTGRAGTGKTTFLKKLKEIWFFCTFDEKVYLEYFCGTFLIKVKIMVKYIV